MSAPSENSSSVEEDTGDEHDVLRNGFAHPSQDIVADGLAHPSQDVDTDDVEHFVGGRIAELLQEERDEGISSQKLGNGLNRYKQVDIENMSEDGSVGAPPRRINSPIDSILSIPDDSPSVQVGHIKKAINERLLILGRARCYPLLPGVAYCHLSHPDLVSIVLLHRFGHSTGDFPPVFLYRP